MSKTPSLNHMLRRLSLSFVFFQELYGLRLVIRSRMHFGFLVVLCPSTENYSPPLSNMLC